MAKGKKKIKVEDPNTFSPNLPGPNDSLQKDIEALKESYEDPETQDWMNASLGKPLTGIPSALSDKESFNTLANLVPNTNYTLIGEDRLAEILFEELLKFKKSKGYAANSPVDLKEIADNVAKSFVTDIL